MGTATVGFKKLTIRILDGKSATQDENLFVIEGKKNKGATSSAKVSGLAVDPVKTWGSNGVYHTSGKGVGDGKIDFDIIDIPDNVQSAILGYTVDEDKIITAGSDTQAPDCSILIEDYDIRGEKLMLGFMTGVFSYDGVEIETLQGKASEIKPDTMTYSVGSDDNGDFFKKYVGSDTAAQDKVLAALEMKTTTP
ncbi:major tail protein [Lactococcus lactis]|uniref:major tail protein n=1 Tax=Lactococcus lactis TaxID=1358 RepID=UPI001D1964F9|nr:major tail protein [Lactococcus lactis]MCC4119856.1 phage tail protein [Lactococcus lactis]MCT0448099.1 phage tail protein [Lactococcus lactis subsp. lactis]